jgi:hypothetical protein
VRSPRTPKLHLVSRVAQICRFTSQPYVRDVRQPRTSLRFCDLLGDPGGRVIDGSGMPASVSKPGTSSARFSAACCGCLASAMLCPAHNEAASISPVVPTIGAAVVEYRTIGSPEAKYAMTSPSLGRLRSGGRPTASHISAVELAMARWAAPSRGRLRRARNNRRDTRCSFLVLRGQIRLTSPADSSDLRPQWAGPDASPELPDTDPADDRAKECQ